MRYSISLYQMCYQSNACATTVSLLPDVLSALYMRYQSLPDVLSAYYVYVRYQSLPDALSI